MRENVLVIGGTSFIGPHVAENFIQNGFRVVLFHRSEYKGNKINTKTEHILGDRKSLADLKSAINKVKPDIIVDMFAMCEEDINILNSALDKKTRVLVVSSMDVYKAYQVINKKSDIMQETPITENSELRDILYPYRGLIDADYAYEYEKILVEKNALSSSMIDSVIVRLGMIYGENDKSDRFGGLVDGMKKDSELIELPKNMQKWVTTKGYVKDIAYGIYLAATKGKSGEIYNLGEEFTLAEESWAKRVAEILLWNGKIEFSKEPINTLNLKQNLVVSTKKIRQELGYKELYSLEDGIRNSINNRAK